jgi:hypothetical protein
MTLRHLGTFLSLSKSGKFDMSFSAFEAISKYCLDKDIDFPVRNQAYAIYTTKHKDAIESYKKSNGNNISPKETNAIEKTLISPSSMDEYINSAAQIITDIKQTAIAPYKNKFKWGEFGVSVGASVLGAFLFLLLLIVLVYAAEEQVKSLVAPLVYPDSSSAESESPNKPLKDDAKKNDGQ